LPHAADARWTQTSPKQGAECTRGFVLFLSTKNWNHALRHIPCLFCDIQILFVSC